MAMPAGVHSCAPAGGDLLQCRGAARMQHSGGPTGRPAIPPPLSFSTVLTANGADPRPQVPTTNAAPKLGAADAAVGKPTEAPASWPAQLAAAAAAGRAAA